jgi:hypothetical protein
MIIAFPTTEAHIAAAERDLGVKLPGEYRLRLLARNGGELSTAGHDWQVFRVLDTTGGEKVVRSANHIVSETKKARGLEGFPKDAVAIASNGAGDYLLLMPARSAGHLDPQVQVWNGETHKCKPVALRYDD